MATNIPQDIQEENAAELQFPKEFENQSWIGPFKIIHRKSSNTFIVTGKNNKNVLVYLNQMKMANECSDDHLALISSRGHPVTRI